MLLNNGNWKTLYRIGGWAALIWIVYSLVTMILLTVVGGQPNTVLEAFELLEENRLVGLLRLDILTVLIMPLNYPIYLTLCIALQKHHPSYATLGALIAFAGITLFLATPSAISMVPLSESYSTSTTVAEQQRLLAAGEALLASNMWANTGAILGGVLILIAGIIFSVLMLSSGVFGRWTAYVGILTHGLDLAHSFAGIFSPTFGVILIAIAGVFYLVWFPLLARDLFLLARSDNTSA